MVKLFSSRKRRSLEFLRRLGVELRRLDRSLVPRDVFEKGSKLLEYSVGLAKVEIWELEGRGHYVVIEPPLSPVDEEAYYEAMETLYFSARMRPGADPSEIVDEVIETVARRFSRKGESPRVEVLKYYLYRDALGYKILDVVMRDPRIEDISVEGVGKPLRVFHRDVSYLDWLVTNIVFRSDDELDSIATLLAHKAKKHVSTAFPIAEGTLPEKHRLALTFSYEVSPFGTGFTIRKFREEPLTIAHLIKFGTLSPLMAAYWWILLEFKGSVFIVGPMASGKTTLLNALLTLLPPNWKIVTIEDTPELRLPHIGWRPLVARHVYSLGESRIAEVTLFDLVKLALRERADFIAVGEIRGEEAYVFMQALATGHGGACLPYDELVLARIDGRPQLVEIGKLVEGIDELGRVEVLSYNEASGEFEWKPVTRVYRVDTDAWIVIRTHEGRTIRATPDHKVAVLRDEKIVYKRADEVREGDVILLMKRLNLETRYRVWDLIEEATRLGLEDNLYVDARDYLVANPVAYRQLLKIYKYASDWRKRAFAPYAKVKGVIPRSTIRAVKYGAKARHAVKPFIPLDRNLGFIIGLYLAEGTIKGAEVRLCLGKEEVELANKLTQIVERVFGIKPRVYEKETSLIVSMPCKLLALIFKHLFGSRAEEKRLPHWMVFETPEEFIEGLVHGYWLGDGHVRRHGKSTYMALAVTVSRTLAMQLHYALKRLGIDSSVRELPKRITTINGRVVTYKHTPYEIKIHGNESMKKFAIIMHLEEPRTSYTRSELITKTKVGRVPENLLVDVVKEVRIIKLDKPEPSYDIEVADNHNFVFNASVLSSNCTFHGDSVESMVARLTTPPINVPIGFLPLISSVVITRYIRIPGRKPVRRVVQVHEIVDAREPREVEYVTVFRWVLDEDKHRPLSADEIVKSSQRLKRVAELAGWDETTLVRELEERASLLSRLVVENRLSYDEVSHEIQLFYKRKWRS